MPGPERLIREAVTLPFGIARRVLGLVGWLLPGGDEEPDTAPLPTEDVEIAVAADDAMTRDRDPVEEAPLLPDDALGGHVETEVEVVAESADPEVSDAPGAEIHVDDELSRP